MNAEFDWEAVVHLAVKQLVSTVMAVRADHPADRVYGAMFHAFYGDGSWIAWPCVTVGTEETLAAVTAAYREKYEGDEADLRWSGADLPLLADPSPEEDERAKIVQACAARTGRYDDWERVYEQFLLCFPAAAKQARAVLVRERVVDKTFVAIAADEGGDLIPLSLTPAQALLHFPQYNAAECERVRIEALPLDDHVAEVVTHAVSLETDSGPLTGDDYDRMVRALGSPAVSALAEVVAGRRAGARWKAAMLLAQINDDRPSVVAALTDALTDASVDLPARSWAASALALLDRMDVIAGLVDSLPVDVVAQGAATPYRSFRDDGRHRRLDYRPLEGLLRRYPHLEPYVARELAPGNGYCTIRTDEVMAARAGLGSTVDLIRAHAAEVLNAHEGSL